jgi:hypothetical protein
MIGIVNADDNFLQGINDRIHQALEAAPVDYVAERYAVLLENNNLYALVILEIPVAWYPVIMGTLTQDEKDMIQTLGPEWL